MTTWEGVAIGPCSVTGHLFIICEGGSPYWLLLSCVCSAV